MRISVHPLFYALAVLLVLFGQAAAFVWTFVAVCLHELGHAAAARLRGYVPKTLTLMPYGAMMSAEEEMDGRSCVLVGLAGPAANLLCAALILALWWVFPAAYPFTRVFLAANLAIALFNLLPVYPLDGSRVLTGLASNRMKAVKRMQAAGIAVSVALFVLFIISFIMKAAAFTLGITAVFLFSGAAFGAKRDTYASVLAAGCKNYRAGVCERSVIVSADTPLVRLFGYVDGRNVTRFRVVEEHADGAPPDEVCVLTEGELRGIAKEGRLSRTLRDCVAAGKGFSPELPPSAISLSENDGGANDADHVRSGIGEKAVKPRGKTRRFRHG